MFVPNDYLLAGTLFLALLFLVIDLWRFENGRDFAKKRLSHYINSAGKRDRLGLLVPSDKLLVTNRPKASAEGSGLRPVSYPRNGRGPLPKAVARAPLGFAVPQKVEVRLAQFRS